MKHLNSSPPRKYTFDEWAWYLKLVGEDESSAETHRAPLTKPKGDGEVAMMDGNKDIKWSWIGNRSPLMGNKEEAQWVLTRLTRTLDRELEEIRKEEMERFGDKAEDEETTSNRPQKGTGENIEGSHSGMEKENKGHRLEPKKGAGDNIEHSKSGVEREGKGNKHT